MYDVTSSFYDALYEGEQIRKFEAASRLAPLLLKEVVLDAGCGTGLITERLRGERRFVVGVDFSKGMLRRAKERLGSRDVDLVLSDVERLPFRPRSFDLVLCLTVLQNCDPLKAISSLLRALKSEGLLVLSYLKRSRSAISIEAVFGDLIVKDADPTDDFLVLSKGVARRFKRRTRKAAVRLYGLSH
jgi:ubiquinone/menaquinone biosynthesis C-methylase UbiE